jgi:hypothetical protein
VDNNFNIYRANGTKVFAKGISFTELYEVDWQPHEKGVLSKPSIDKIKKMEVQEANAKPKRIFKFGKGGENTAF